MNIHFFNNIYFIGIGGIGMSALARYFKAKGKNVSGYDKTPTRLTNELVAEGIAVHFSDDIRLTDSTVCNSPAATLVVYTPAVPAQHGELRYFQKNGFVVKKRSEVLGDITKHSFTIAVAGTHGKTTTSSLITHILYSSGMSSSAFLGGIMQNYNTNLLLSSDPEAKVVVEADEYDRSFLTLFPDIAVITSMDADHLDIYKEKSYMEDSYRLFAGQVKEGGLLIHKKDLVLPHSEKNKSLTYSVNPGADFTAKNISVRQGSFVFDFSGKDEHITGIRSCMPGRHNIENAVAAITVARQLGINEEKIKEALESFRGVRRRFEYVVKSDDLVFIDDYAHHPEELRACILAVKELYPGKKITGVFQPHLFTRTRDFYDDFARSLELLDELILLEIYPAREQPIEGVCSETLLKKIVINNKMLLSDMLKLPEVIANRKVEVLLTLGAGNIDQMVEPVKKVFVSR